MPSFVRLVVVLVVLLACLFGMASASKAGLSRLLTEEALAHNDVNLANEAVRLEPGDPEAYYAAGVLSYGSASFAEAISNFKESVRLRPQDRSAWLELGRSYQASGNLPSATEALTVAVQLAPYYAEPRWFLGNCLLSSGRREEAFRQLTIAAQSDPALLPGVIDLAWRAHRGSAAEVLQAIEPQTDAARVVLASFFIEQNRMKEALSLLRSSGRGADYDRHRFTIQLVEKNRFRDAADVFNTGAGSIGEATINDGDFEHSRLSFDLAFGWQPQREPGTTRIAVDTENAYSGTRSLSLVFNGFTGDDAEFVKQLVLLEPRKRYRLSFSSRSQDLESEALPRVAVVEAGPAGPLLAQSEPVTANTGGWSTQNIDFETTGLTQAIYLVVQRQRCPSEVCPIFGRVWFDNFSLTKV